MMQSFCAADLLLVHKAKHAPGMLVNALVQALCFAQGVRLALMSWAGRQATEPCGGQTGWGGQPLGRILLDADQHPLPASGQDAPL